MGKVLTAAVLYISLILAGGFLGSQTPRPKIDGAALYCDPVVVNQFKAAWDATEGGTQENGTLETGFRIDYIDGRVEVGPIVYGWGTPFRVWIPVSLDTVAIAHVHPKNGISHPSEIDLAINYPNYVITKDGLYVTYPGTGKWRYVRNFRQEFNCESCETPKPFDWPKEGR